MLRAAALSLLILASVALTLPFIDSSAHSNGRPSAGRHHHMGRRHSRAWWRHHRARLRRQRAALKLKQTLQVVRGQSLNSAAESHNNTALPERAGVASIAPKSPLSGLSLPSGWSRRAAANGETKFLLNAPNGQSIGVATLSLVNSQASGETVLSGRANRRMLAGVPFADLRRTVIDKMVAANGWVINDLQREIEGKPVFIVLAQTAASSDGRTPQLSWVFYFTEVEGRIYGLATSSLLEFSDRIADEAAQFMASFHANSRRAAAETSIR